MASVKESYGVLVGKLKTPHPAVQRAAVKCIMEKLKKKGGDGGGAMESSDADEALSHCLSSSSPAAVVDECAAQLCSLVKEGHMPILQALHHLQSALESASSHHTLAPIVRSIAFLCHILIHTDDHHLLSLCKSNDHPFLKAFRSSSLCHSELLQQLVLLVFGSRSHIHSLQFLQPFITGVLLQPSALCTHSLFSRQLHFHLASIASLGTHMGKSILRLLTRYIDHYPLQTVQDVDLVFAAVREIVDALESAVKQASLKENVDEYKKIVRGLLDSLIELSYKIQDHGFSLLPVLELSRRVTELRRLYKQDAYHVFDWKMILLAYMLAISSLEQEQMLILKLAVTWLEEGSELLNRSKIAVPCILVWIFPSLHVMTSSRTLVKSAATKLLVHIEKLLEEPLVPDQIHGGVDLEMHANSPHGNLAVAMHRLLNLLWFQENLWETWSSLTTRNSDSPSSTGKSNSTIWMQSLQKHLENLVEGRSVTSFHHHKGFASWLCIMVTALVMHPTASVTACEAMSTVARNLPISGLSLLPVLLFHLRLCIQRDHISSVTSLLGILQVLPSLASHPAASPLVTQILQPMLDSNANYILQATAIRLFCNTWRFTDRVFSQLKMLLQPNMFSLPATKMDIILSRSISLYDVCKTDADRGIELVLSIQKCIESNIHNVQAFGLQSLAALCERDAVDFYTAWLVISKSFTELPSDPILAKSFCEFLGNGALDAEAYYDASNVVLMYLWEATQLVKDGWAIVQEAALKALLKYKVDVLQKSMENNPAKHFQLLISELSPKAVQACEELVVKFLLYEHINRRRVVKEGRGGVNKLRKFLGALPRILLQSSEKGAFENNFSGALLLSSPLPSPGANNQSSKFGIKAYLKALHDRDAEHEQFFMDVANEMSTSGNLIMALVSLRSWSSFIKTWMKAKVSIFEAENATTTKAKSYMMAAEDIKKTLVRISEQSVPRVAENAILALGALFQAVPSCCHSLCAPMSKLLEGWLSEEGHEYMQWTAALSLGVLSQSLHSTDWMIKSRIVNILLQHASKSDRDVVKGACSIALAFMCQNLQDKSEDDKPPTEETDTMRETRNDLLVYVVYSTAKLLYQKDCLAENFLQKLHKSDIFENSFRTMGMHYFESKLPSFANSEGDEDNIWAVAGLAVVLGGTVTPLEKAGSPDLVLAITEFLISAVSSINSESSLYPGMYLAVGALLSLPTCLKACLRLELLGEKVNVLLEASQAFIQRLTTQECQKGYPGSLINVACIGLGNLLAILMEDGTNLVKSEKVFKLLESFKNIWKVDLLGSGLGSVIGFANACGAAVGLFLPSEYYQKGQSEKLKILSIYSPILFDEYYEEFTLSLFQELLAVIHAKTNHQLKKYAACALALARNTFFEIYETGFTSSRRGLGTHKTDSQLAAITSLPENSTIRLLCSWLVSLRSIEIESPFPYREVSSVLRSLGKAPCLPALDWGVIIRLLLRQTTPVFQLVHDWDEMRKQCLLFAVSQADKVSTLTNLLDELCELSRLTLLDPSLSNLLLLHIVDLKNIFSYSRMESFLDNITEFVRRSHVTTSKRDPLSMDRGSHLRINIWKGFKYLLSKMKNETDEKSQVENQSVIQSVENCMEILLGFLPQLECSAIPVVRQSMQEEWSTAIDCMAEASDEWLLKITQIGQVDALNREPMMLQKTIFIASQEVAKGKLAVCKLKRGIMICLDKRMSEIWHILVVLSLALKHAKIEERRQWLVDTIEYASLTSHPETAMLFLGLLVNSSSQYSPFLCVDILSSLYDLSFTLPLLLSESIWKDSASLITQKCFSLMLKLSSMEGEIPDVLVSVLEKICIALKQHLPVSDQIKLAEMTYPSFMESKRFTCL